MDNTRRLLDLESSIDALASQVDLAGQMARRITSPSFRLAKSVSHGGPYPTTGQTFHIEFCDGTFTLSPGGSAPVYSRRLPQRVICCNVAGTLPPENTKLIAYWWSGRWWTSWKTPSGGPPEILSGWFDVDSIERRTKFGGVVAWTSTSIAGTVGWYRSPSDGFEYRACVQMHLLGAWADIPIDDFTSIELRVQTRRFGPTHPGMSPLVPPHMASVEGLLVATPAGIGALLPTYPTENWPTTGALGFGECFDELAPTQYTIFDVTDIIEQQRTLDLTTLAFLIKALWVEGPPYTEPVTDKYALEVLTTFDPDVNLWGIP
jgi:hypothetical protein